MFCRCDFLLCNKAVPNGHSASAPSAPEDRFFIERILMLHIDRQQYQEFIYTSASEYYGSYTNELTGT